DSWSSQRFRRIRRDQAFALAVAKKASQAGHPTRDRGASVIAFVKIRDVASQLCDMHVTRFRHVADTVFEVIEQAAKVFVVRLQRQFGRIPLDLQIPQKSINRTIHSDGLWSPPACGGRNCDQAADRRIRLGGSLVSLGSLSRSLRTRWLSVAASYQEKFN